MKTTNKALVILLIIIAAGSYRCSEDVSPTENAILVTQLSVIEIPGYDWFIATKKQYHPDTNAVKEIMQVFDSNKHHFIIFSKPACSCDEKQRLFPNAMKVLDSAGILENNFILYSVKSTKTLHPYDSIITLHFVPAMILMVDGKPVYSIIDSIVNSNVNDFKIEIEILKALKKYQ